MCGDSFQPNTSCASLSGTACKAELVDTVNVPLDFGSKVLLSNFEISQGSHKQIKNGTERRDVDEGIIAKWMGLWQP